MTRKNTVVSKKGTREIAEIRELPASPAIYALCGGRGYVAYVGMGDNLRRRIDQHLLKRDSSVATRASTVGLSPELVTEVRWWEHEQFARRTPLKAAELIAFERLNPALRSRSGISKDADSLSRERQFRQVMVTLFEGGPTGRLVRPSIESLLMRISELEQRVSTLEADRKSK